MYKNFVAFLLMMFPTFAIAQQCESIIALSKTTATTVSDKDSVEQHAANFCGEYSKSAGKTSSASFGASYKFLSASFGSTDASMEIVASKYCSASSNFSQSKDAYKQYVESISPNSYAAYEQCLRMSKLDITFNLDAASMLPDEFSMTVSFASTSHENQKATVGFSSSSGVQCTWDGASAPQKKLITGSSTILQCKRQDQTKPAYVVVTRVDGAKESMSIPWKPYTKDGVPMETLANIQTDISKINKKLLETLSGVMRIEGAPMIQVYQCPRGTNGWNPGGAWGSYGCQGQISTSAKCTNIEYPHNQTLDCKPLGKLRLY